MAKNPLFASLYDYRINLQNQQAQRDYALAEQAKQRQAQDAIATQDLYGKSLDRYAALTEKQLNSKLKIWETTAKLAALRGKPVPQAPEGPFQARMEEVGQAAGMIGEYEREQGEAARAKEVEEKVYERGRDKTEDELKQQKFNQDIVKHDEEMALKQEENAIARMKANKEAKDRLQLLSKEQRLFAQQQIDALNIRFKQAKEAIDTEVKNSSIIDLTTNKMMSGPKTPEIMSKYDPLNDNYIAAMEDIFIQSGETPTAAARRAGQYKAMIPRMAAESAAVPGGITAEQLAEEARRIRTGR